MHVGRDEPGSQPYLVRYRTGGLDSLLGEVQAGHVCAAPGPGQGVEPEMALQVDQPPTGDLPDFGQLELPQSLSAGLEPSQVIEVAGQVNRDSFIPERLVDRKVVGIRHSRERNDHE